MTEQEAVDLKEFARAAMPKSSDAQCVLLEFAIKPYSFAIAEECLVQHALQSEFISVPDIIRRMRSMSGSAYAKEKYEKERAAAQAARDSERRDKAEMDKSVTAARVFCESHPDRLDEWRAAIVAKQPYLGKLTERKKTLESTALVCAIYAEFGKIPVECGL